MKSNLYKALSSIIIALVFIPSACTNHSDLNSTTSNSSQPLTQKSSSQMSRMPDFALHRHSVASADCRVDVGIKIKIFFFNYIYHLRMGCTQSQFEKQEL